MQRALFFADNITNYKEHRTIHPSIMSRCLLLKLHLFHCLSFLMVQGALGFW